MLCNTFGKSSDLKISSSRIPRKNVVLLFNKKGFFKKDTGFYEAANGKFIFCSRSEIEII